MKTIKYLANAYRVSELCLWQLIRSGQIKSKADLHGVYIDPMELKNFFDNHLDFLAAKQQALSDTQDNLI